MVEGIVVVTGASGYIGSHIVANLLKRGREVRATVRDASDPERVDHLRALDISYQGSLEIVEMDLFDTASVDAAIKGCSDVIHTAASVIIRASNPQKKIVDPSVIGTQNIVDSIERAGSVKRFIHTSSTAAIRPMEWTDGQMLTSDTWADDATVDRILRHAQFAGQHRPQPVALARHRPQPPRGGEGHVALLHVAHVGHEAHRHDLGREGAVGGDELDACTGFRDHVDRLQRRVVACVVEDQSLLLQQNISYIRPVEGVESSPYVLGG